MSEIGRSTWRAMNPSVSLTSDLRSRRSATPTSAGVATIKGSIEARIRAGGPKARSEPGLDLAQAPGGAALVQGVGRIRNRSGRQHHDAVRDRPPAGRFDAGRGQPLEPVAFRENGGWRKDQGRRLRRDERRGEAPPVGDGGDSGRAAPIAAKQEDLGVADAMRRKRRALGKAEPQDDRVATPPRRAAGRPRRGRGSGKKNKNRRFRHGLQDVPWATPGTPPRRQLLIDDFARRS